MPRLARCGMPPLAPTPVRPLQPSSPPSAPQLLKGSFCLRPTCFCCLHSLSCSPTHFQRVSRSGRLAWLLPFSPQSVQCAGFSPRHLRTPRTCQTSPHLRPALLPVLPDLPGKPVPKPPWPMQQTMSRTPTHTCLRGQLTRPVAPLASHPTLAPKPIPMARSCHLATSHLLTCHAPCSPARPTPHKASRGQHTRLAFSCALHASLCFPAAFTSFSFPNPA